MRNIVIQITNTVSHNMTVCNMTVCKMTVCKMTVCKMTVCKMTVGKMTVCNMSVLKLWYGQRLCNNNNMIMHMMLAQVTILK